MENVTLRIPQELLDDLDDEADEHDENRSEYIRNLLVTRHDHEARIEELENELDRLRNERDDLQRQLREANRRNREIGELIEYVDHERDLQRKERIRMQSGVVDRVRWWLFGMDE